MKKQPKIGLLCLYVKLYDDTVPSLRPDVEAFAAEIAQALGGKGLEVVTHGICRLEGEFREAVTHFETAGVDALVTLHLAYSPSLESERVLRETKLPIIVLDTTPDHSFDGVTGAGRIMQNHGIHGVQDMCSLLRRNSVPFQIYAGHYKNSPVLAQVAQAARGAMMANVIKQCRVGQIGKPFDGMGDFRVPASDLQALGVEVVEYDFSKSAALLSDVGEDAIRAEWEKDCARFQCRGLSYETYAASARMDLAVRRWISENSLDALTVNFMATDHNPDLPRMPFMEMCKAMENGCGYAGEGDVLTAAFVAALMRGFPETTFAEMFCPDWEGDTVFLSHMGEFNIALADGTPLLTEMDFPYTSAGNPAALYGGMKPGRAAFVNLNPLGGGRYVLIAAGGDMVRMPEVAAAFENSVRGWFQPNVPLAVFLAEYSRRGGGHHGAIVYQYDMDSLRCFAETMGWDFEEIR